jgi:hypothetical protein
MLQQRHISIDLIQDTKSETDEGGRRKMVVCRAGRYEAIYDDR